MNSADFSLESRADVGTFSFVIVTISKSPSCRFEANVHRDHNTGELSIIIYGCLLRRDLKQHNYGPLFTAYTWRMFVEGNMWT